MANVTLRIRARCPSQTVVTATFLPSGQEHYQIEKPPEHNAWEFAGRTFRSLADCTRVVHRRSEPISRREDLLVLWETVDDDPPKLLSLLRSKISPKFTRLGPQINTDMSKCLQVENDDTPKPVPKTRKRKPPAQTTDDTETKTETEEKPKPKPKSRKRTATAAATRSRAVRAPRIPHPTPVFLQDDCEPPEVLDTKEGDDSDCPNLHTLSTKDWTENALHRFFNRPARSADTDPVLLGFGPRAKRYGPGACFKFKCDFVHPKTQQVIRQWVRYTDLVPNPAYMDKLAAIHFNISRARYQFLETNDTDDWSDGVDEFLDNQGKSFPDLSLDQVNANNVTAKQTGTSKKKTKYAEFSIARFGNHPEKIEDVEDDVEPEHIGNLADYNTTRG